MMYSKWRDGERMNNIEKAVKDRRINGGGTVCLLRVSNGKSPSVTVGRNETVARF